MFKVTYKNIETGVEYPKEFATELEAVRCIGNAELYVNLEVVSYSDNIDRSKFRY
jgi:hypothetical protein